MKALPPEPLGEQDNFRTAHFAFSSVKARPSKGLCTQHGK